MRVKMKKLVNVPYGYYCEKCSAKKISNERPYCVITGLFLQQTPQGKCLKTDECFKEIKLHLKNGG